MEWKIKVNEDCELVQTIRQALRANDGYCPCAAERTKDTVCPCTNFVNQDEAGLCHCGLYEKVPKQNLTLEEMCDIIKEKGENR